MKAFNLLASTYRNKEDDCISEAWYLFRELGDEGVEAWRTKIPGLIAIRTSLDPFDAVHRLEALARERPWDFRYLLKLTPIEVVVKTDLDEIARAAEELGNRKIAEDETYRVTVNKRATLLKTEEIIQAVASRIKRKVDLRNPDKIVQVEVVAEATGVSVLRPEDVVSIVKLLRR